MMSAPHACGGVGPIGLGTIGRRTGPLVPKSQFDFCFRLSLFRIPRLDNEESASRSDLLGAFSPSSTHMRLFNCPE
jgi:hypothetical protein